MIFEILLGTCHVVIHCSGTPTPKFYFNLLLFHLAHGLTRPQKTPKTVFAILKKNNTKQILILNFFDNCSFMPKEGCWNFKKIFIFKVSVFSGNENFGARSAKFADFFEMTS